MKDLHFRYFKQLELDISESFRYVEPVTENERTYSVTFLRLYLAACAEFEVVLKQVCSQILQKNQSHAKMPELAKTLLQRFPRFGEMEILLPAFQKRVRPFESWMPSVDPTGDNGDNGDNLPSPTWWKHYNAVKHSREANYKFANMQNVLLATAALYCILLYWYRIDADNGLGIPFPKETGVFSYEKLGFNSVLMTGRTGLSLPDFPTDGR